MKDLIEPDIVPLARFGRERGYRVRFIEFMPLDAQSLWDRGHVLMADDMLEMLAREIGPLDAVPDPIRAPLPPIPLSRRHRLGRIHRLSQPAVSA